MPQSRQLAAIMFTDIVGYTVLMGDDEESAFELLNKNRLLQKPLIEQYGGKWIKELGDGVLATFSTVTDAVNCACSIIKGCEQVHGLKLRIGIHQAEVIFENNDVFGDGVNIASRLQSIAPIGGICISETVRNNISNRKEIKTSFIKEETLKHVKEPIRIYEVATENKQVKEEVSFNLTTPKITPEKSIAVLPFINMSSDPEQEYFSDGMAQELILSLSRIKNVKVISRTTSMQYKGAKKDIKSIGRELSVSYIMEGSVRKFLENIKITAQLIDVENDKNVWGETFKGKLNDIFDIQEEVAQKIVAALMITLSPIERVELTKRPTFNAEAYDYYWRARNLLYRQTKNNIELAIQLFEKAIELDEKYAQAYAGFSEAYATLYRNFERKTELNEKAIASALKSLKYDPILSEAYAALGLAFFNKGDLKGAISACEKAIELEPDNFIGYWLLADIYHQLDKDEKALEMYHMVIKLNPLFCPAYGHMRMMYERLGKREEYNNILHIAVENSFPQYLEQYPDDARGHMFFAIESAEAGLTAQAEKELLKAIELSSGDPFIMYGVTCFYSRKGEKEKALNALKEVLSHGYINYEWIKRDPDLDNIRNEPEYSILMKEK